MEEKSNIEENIAFENNDTDTKFAEGLDFSDLDKKIANLENTNYNNPFLEEFNPKDVINRGNPSDFIVDDLLKIKQAEIEEAKKLNKEQFYISKRELVLLINENPRVKVYKKDNNGEFVTLEEEENINSNSFLNELDGLDADELIEIAVPVGKKETKPNRPTSITNTSKYEDEYYYSNEGDDDVYYISDEESEKIRRKEKIQETLKVVQDVIDELSEKEKYINPDELFKEFLQENFKDFILAKKISGNIKTKYSDKILQAENIHNESKQVEVSDFLDNNNIGGNKTSILINRDTDMEIESIEVYCKCGEKTIIRFLEQNDLKTDTYETQQIENKYRTDIVVDTIDIAPIFSGKDKDAEKEFEEKIADEEIAEIERIQEEDE